jgi:hypothetical protein
LSSREQDSRTWYVAYGSNLARARLTCYLAGGCPAGGRRTYAGCRDISAPDRVVSLELPGMLRFSGSSTVWSGGLASYDPSSGGQVAARAYLLTAEQVNDIFVQETRRALGTDLGLADLQPGAEHPLGDGHYDTVLRLPDIEELAALTLTAAEAGAPRAPAAAYLRWICTGLAEGHGWQPERIAGYLTAFDGVRGHWTLEAVTALCRPGSAPPDP